MKLEFGDGQSIRNRDFYMEYNTREHARKFHARIVEVIKWRRPMTIEEIAKKARVHEIFVQGCLQQMRMEGAVEKKEEKYRWVAE